MRKSLYSLSSDFTVYGSVRLENEHLGNMDQYRVTREVPLPYRFDETAHEEDDDADEDGVSHKGWLR